MIKKVIVFTALLVGAHNQASAIEPCDLINIKGLDYFFSQLTIGDFVKSDMHNFASGKESLYMGGLKAYSATNYQGNKALFNTYSNSQLSDNRIFIKIEQVLPKKKITLCKIIMKEKKSDKVFFTRTYETTLLTDQGKTKLTNNLSSQLDKE